jgi:hypothetical protein
MTNLKDFLVAKIDIKNLAGDDLSWITTQSSIFDQCDMLEMINQFLDDAFLIYKKTYLKVEKKLYITQKLELLKYNRWVLVYDGDQMVFISLYREHTKGIKLGITGTNGSNAAKNVLINFHRKAFNIDHVFGEVSPPLENVLKGHVPIVPATKSAKILEKQISPAPDGFYYYRSIGKLGPKKKLLVGKPK